MSINPLNGLTPASFGAETNAPSKEFGEKEFLTLLMTQMQHQDPLNPMESAQFMDQLSSMNTVQQLIEANGRLEELTMGLGSLNNQAAVDLVGKEVIAKGDTVTHKAGTTEDLRFDLGTEAARATVTIKDENGILVDTLELGDLKAGVQTTTWAGTTAAGHVLPDGKYSFAIYAEDADGNPVESQTYVRGLVEEIRFDEGYPVMVVDGTEVGMDGILRVLTGDPTNEADALPAPAAEAESESEAQDQAMAAPLSPAELMELLSI